MLYSWKISFGIVRLCITKQNGLVLKINSIEPTPSVQLRAGPELSGALSKTKKNWFHVRNKKNLVFLYMNKKSWFYGDEGKYDKFRVAN